MKVVVSKTTQYGVVNIMDAGEGKKELLARNKRYWISYGDGSPRTCIHRSNSLVYLKKIFDKIK